MKLMEMPARAYRLLKDPHRLRLRIFQKYGIWIRQRVPEFPPIVMIDTSTRCNLKCTHCPHSALEREPDFIGDMDTALYRKIIDQVAVYPGTLVRPFDGGEPLVRKDIAELITYAKHKGIRHVSINSNGTLLSENIGRELVKAGLDHMEISIDAATPETYLAIRRSGLFGRVVANVQAFHALMKEAGPNRRVTVSFILQSGNAHELAAFRAFWDGKVDGVNVREYHQHNALVEKDVRARRHTFERRHPCPYLWERIIIYHDGRVRFCESDWMAQHAVGDLREASIKEIWNGSAYRRLRQSHVAGSFDHPFCAGCTDWREVR